MDTIKKITSNSWVLITLLTLVYYLAGKFGLLFSEHSGDASIIWPAPGLALAAVLIYGYRVWPGILMGALLLHMNSTGTIVTAFIVAGSTLQPLCSAFLIKHFTNDVDRLIRGKQISIFFVLAVPLGCLISTLLGATAQYSLQKMDALDFYINWGVWWFGNMMGVVVFTPLCRVLVNKKEFNATKKTQVCVALLCAFVLVVVSFIFLSYTEKVFINEVPLEFKIYILWLTLVMSYAFVSFIAVITLILTGRGILSEKYVRESTNDVIVYKELLSQTNDLAEVGGWEFDLLNNKLRWTEQCYRMHEVPLDYEINQDTILNFCVPEYREIVENAPYDAVTNGQSWDLEYEIITAKGNRRRLRANGRGYFKNNKMIKIFGFLQDITERRAMEKEREFLLDQLQHAQKMEAVGQLAGGMSHEFNNMLQAILGYAYLALNEYGKEGNLNKYLEQICAAGERAQNLVSQILSYSRSSFSNPELVDPGVIVEEALLMLKPAMPSTIKINQFIASGLSKVLVDKNQLNQVIVNLCINARDAMGGKGVLSIKIQMVNEEGYCASCHKLFYGPFVEISVRDNGPGIDAEKQMRIFDPFFTTKEIGKGTGMGLAVVHGIVHENNGHIELLSSENSGAEFKVLLPAQTDVDNVEIKKRNAVEKINGKPISILVVDDEKMLTDLLEASLMSKGHRVSCFNNPVVALEAYTKNNKNVDLVILDQTMPDMTGLELAEAMLQLNKNQKIILYTGYGAEIAESKVMEKGIKALWRKPVNIEKLLVFIDELSQE